MNWKSSIGFWRSVMMYYWKPFNQRRLKRFYQSFIRPGALCFDLGAHLGNRSKAWLALGAKVVAIEPQPICIQFLEKKFRNNPQFILEAKAVGAKPGTLPMYLSHNAPTVSSLADENWRNELNKRSSFEVEWNEQIQVSVTTLDQLIGQYGIPDFCKIDVEDFEEEVLKGLSVPIPVISFEFFNWTSPRTRACLELLLNLAPYEFNWSIGESQRLALSSWTDSTALLKSIETFEKKQTFSGDIYGRLKTK